MFPQVFGKYVLERELASGGMAVVYLATLRGAGGFEKRLVVKQIRAELASDRAFVERFVAEAKTTVELSHPNIVPVYELGVEQGVYFIAMELALGVTLADLLRATGRVSPAEGAYLGIEVCRALDYAHRKAGVVHRDATPRNVIIDEEGAVRLIDFGIAAAVSADDVARERVFGSPGHMPIEQLKGGRLTPATDVFAIGALLIEAWTGNAPFRRKTQEESDLALKTKPPPPSEADALLAPLDGVVLAAVAFEAENRPQTADELARPLREFLRNQDLGDIARRLGQRVLEVRKQGDGDSRSASPSVRPSAPAVTPTTRPLIQSETFATREIPVTREPPEEPRSEESNPLDMDAGAEASAERVARAPVSRQVGFAYAAAALFSVVLAGAVYELRSRPIRGPAPNPGMPEAPAPPSAPASSVAELPLAPSKAPANSVPAVPTPAGASSDEPVRAGSATLNLTADLPARVTIDGSTLGTTPLRGLRRPAGAHVVVFTSLELDEHLTARIEPKTGETISVHAEFTRPTPALRIH